LGAKIGPNLDVFSKENQVKKLILIALTMAAISAQASNTAAGSSSMKLSTEPSISELSQEITYTSGMVNSSRMTNPITGRAFSALNTAYVIQRDEAKKSAVVSQAGLTDLETPTLSY
jgi:hypothetical protein